MSDQVSTLNNFRIEKGSSKPDDQTELKPDCNVKMNNAECIPQVKTEEDGRVLNSIKSEEPGLNFNIPGIEEKMNVADVSSCQEGYCDSTDQDQVKVYVCGTCPYSSNHLFEVRQHNISHTMENCYVCDLCQSTYQYFLDFKCHLKSHTAQDGISLPESQTGLGNSLTRDIYEYQSIKQKDSPVGETYAFNQGEYVGGGVHKLMQPKRKHAEQDYRHDSDSDSDLSWAGSGKPDSESDQDDDELAEPNTHRPVDVSGSSSSCEDSDSEPVVSTGGRGRNGPTADGYNWIYLNDEETIDPLAWKMHFRGDRTGIVNLDTTNFEPINYFDVFFPRKARDLIRDETNRNGNNVMAQATPADLLTRSRKCKWKQVEDTELDAYLGLQIAMGLCEKPAEVDHWNTTFWVNHTSYSQVLSRDRYQMISSFLHFCNNDQRIPRGQPGYNPAFKIQPLWDIITPLWLQYFEPGMELSIDESTKRFKGRIHFRQCLPKKPNKWGFKIFALADSTTGYLLKSRIYTGKDYFVDNPHDGLSEAIVWDLLEGFENKGHVLFCDNFYSSPSLFRVLSEHQIGAVGTCNDTRKGFPAKLKTKNKKMRRGEDPAFARCGTLLAATFHDTKRVSLLSTVHKNTTIEKRIRSKKETTGFRVIKKPTCAEDYNHNMNGVDNFDQKSGYYAYPYRCQKWYLPLFHFLVEAALVNAFILFQLSNPTSGMTSKKFREHVCLKLIQGQAIERLAARQAPAPPQPGIPLRINAPHYVRKYENKKHRPNCLVCSSVGKRSQTRFYCPDCAKSLCISPCFWLYHKEENYSAARRRLLDEETQTNQNKRQRRQ